MFVAFLQQLIRNECCNEYYTLFNVNLYFYTGKTWMYCLFQSFGCAVFTKCSDEVRLPTT